MLGIQQKPWTMRNLFLMCFRWIHFMAVSLFYFNHNFQLPGVIMIIEMSVVSYNNINYGEQLWLMHFLSTQPSIHYYVNHVILWALDE